MEYIAHRLADAIGEFRNTASPEALPIMAWLLEFAVGACGLVHLWTHERLTAWRA